MNREFTLDEASEKAVLIVTGLAATGLLRVKMLQMGITPGTKLEVLRRAPLADPIEIKVRGACIALRSKECKNISVVRVVGKWKK